MDATNLIRLYNEYFAEHPSVILDVGSHDLKDALILANHFLNAKVHAFEAMPMMYDVCVRNNNIPDRISVINAAVTNKDSIINFYKINGWLGASSILEPVTNDNNTDIVPVEGIRIDTYAKSHNISKIDLIWMDAQGAELLCLEGIGDYIYDVKMIQSEVGIQAYYKNHNLYPEIKSYLEEKGFRELQYVPDWSHESNVVFINTKYETL
jgi:FkbM family methyltransferase